MELALKQELLSIRNEFERIQRVMEAMIEIIEKLGRVEKAQRKAGGNGHCTDDD